MLLAAGEKGRRFALRHSRVLLHQPSAVASTVSDLALQADELLRVRSQVEEVLSRHTGRSIAQLRTDTDRTRSSPRSRPWSSESSTTSSSELSRRSLLLAVGESDLRRGSLPRTLDLTTERRPR